MEPVPNRGEFVTTMVETARVAIEERDASGYFSWVRFGTVGAHTILDAALCSLAMHLVGKQVQDANMIAHSRTMYGQSLGNLQSALRHPTKWRASETLCSAILLCVFEVRPCFNLRQRQSADYWAAICRNKLVGLVATACARHWHPHGAARCRSAPRRLGCRHAAIIQRSSGGFYKTYTGNNESRLTGSKIMGDLFYPRGDACFLTRPEWRAVTRDRGRHLLQAPDFDDEGIEAVDEFNNRLAEVPSVVRVGYPVMEAAKRGLPIDMAAAATTCKLAAACHARMSEFWATYRHIFPAATEIPSRDPESLYAVVLRYPKRWAATMQLSFYATMCLLQEFMQQTGWREEFATPQSEYVQIILRSVEDISQGPMGPYRIGYALRIAYELADAEAQEWIRGCLDRFKNVYAATDKTTYPEMRTDSGGYR